jgi:uncharacterized membrane protein YfbV (UPF0208 family)
VTDFPDHLDDRSDIEALVRSARDYVQPSDDLRPRVLENARVVRGERRARRWIGHLAICALLLGMFAAATSQQSKAVATREPAAMMRASRLFWSPQPTLSASDASWGMVDSFTELRRRQAELLRPAL